MYKQSSCTPEIKLMSINTGVKALQLHPSRIPCISLSCTKLLITIDPKLGLPHCPITLHGRTSAFHKGSLSCVCASTCEMTEIRGFDPFIPGFQLQQLPQHQRPGRAISKDDTLFTTLTSILINSEYRHRYRMSNLTSPLGLPRLCSALTCHSACRRFGFNDSLQHGLHYTL
jgi:hypothetical protein